MRKAFIIVCCVFLCVIGYRLYFARFFGGIGSGKKQVEVISELEGMTVLGNETSLNDILSRFNVWEEGVCIRREPDEEKPGQISKSFFGKIRVVLTYDYENYKRDRVFLGNVSENELISSAEENMVGDDLIISLGFSKEFLDGLDDERKEMYLTQSFITTLYRISHTNQDFKSKEEDLKGILVEYIGANRSLFEIK